jgi:fructose 1,6-bisphosphatase
MTDQTLQATLDERGSNYGPFDGHSMAAQQLKKVVRSHLSSNKRYNDLNAVQMATVDEGLDMIMHKVARLINGDPLHDDSWVDIAGYATITNKFANGDGK